MAIVAVLFIVSLNLFQKETKNFFYLMSAPIQKMFWRAGNGVSLFFAFLIEARTLKKETDELRLKNWALIGENIKLVSLQKENETLREALKIGLEKDYNLIFFARVISKDILGDSILIDKGLRDGVLEKLPVITKEKILCGKINEVYKNFSKVELISNKNFSFDVQLKNTGEPALARGEGNLKTIIDFIPFASQVKVGDEVVSSQLGGVFPANLLIGEIKELIKSDTEPFQKAKIKPACHFSDLDELFVVKWEGPQ